MKQFIWILVCFALAGSMSSCTLNAISQQEEDNTNEIVSYGKTKGLTLQKSPEGMYYSINASASTGKKAAPTDLMKIYYTMSLLDGKKLDSTAKSLGQVKGVVWGSTQNIFTLPLSFMKEGDKGVFILPSSLAFGGNSYTDIPAFSIIRIDIEIVNVRTEAEQIEDFKTTYKIVNPEVTASGLVFKKLVEKPTGAVIVAGQTVKINYTGRFSYGVLQTDAAGKTVYDSSFGSGTLTFIPGAGNLIVGFEEGVRKLRVGEKGALIMPSSLAYGAAGNSTIPGSSPLYFEVEVVGAL